MTRTASDAAIETRYGVGIGLMVLSVGVFVSMDAVVKHLALAGFPTLQILFFRSVFAFFPIMVLVMMQGGPRTLATRRPFGHLVRALIGMTAMGSFFYAYKELPLSDAVAISFAAPIFMTALSVPLLKEPVGIRRWTAVLIGFVGVVVMVRPTGDVQTASIIVLFGTAFYALAMITVRRLSATESSAAIVFYFTIAGTVLTGVLLPWNWVTPDATALLMLAGVGLLGGIAQILMTTAIKAAPIAVLAPFEYTALVWAAGFDIVFWGLFPAVNTLWGAGVVAATGLYIVHRETKLGVRKRFPARFSRIKVSVSERE